MHAGTVRQSNYEAALMRLEKGMSQLQIDKAESAPAAKRARTETTLGEEKPKLGSAALSSPHLTLDEVQQLLRHFEYRVQEVCKDCGFDRAISATAVIYFKRFYLHASVPEYHPAAVMYGTIFLAIKTEACPYTEVTPFCDRLQRRERLTDDELVGLEPSLLMGLKYHLTVYHPYRPLKALLIEMITAYANAAQAAPAVNGSAANDSTAEKPAGPLLPAASEGFESQWDVIQSRAFELVDIALTTDLPLLHTPPQIAAGCLLLASRSTVSAADGALSVLPLAETAWYVPFFLTRKLTSQVSTGAAEVLAESTGAIHGAIIIVENIADSLATQLRMHLEKEEVENLLHRLTRTMNPAFQRGTPEFAARVAFGRAEIQAYKDSKTESRKQAISMAST